MEIVPIPSVKLFDSHAHVYDKAFDNDREAMMAEVWKRCDYVTCPSEDLASSEQAVAVAEKYPNLYAAVGIHPQVTAQATDEELAAIRELAEEHKKVVAIGEIGLDYYYLYSEVETQKIWFARQIEMAKELDLPIIIHDRDAHGDTLQILKEHAGPKLRGIMHCCSFSAEMAKEFIKLGFYISFAGPVVFPKSTALKEVAKAVPLEWMLIETDSPYLTPPPFRGRRNDPTKVYYVAEEIARLKEIPVEEVIEATKQNALKIYQIK